MIRTEDFAQVEVTSAAQLRQWLDAHHGQDESVWLVTWKKHAGDRYVSTHQVLDELVAFGWTDGVRRRLDDDRTMQLISRRRVLHWHRSYQERAERLAVEGRMHPAGLAAIEASKAAGLWDYMADVDDLATPPDLVEALARHPGATENFDAFPPAARRNTLRWIKLARTSGTRAKRLEQTASLAARNERVPGT